MELVRYLHNIKARHHGCVLTIGNFDGVHLGHQAVIKQLNEASSRLELPNVVLTFEPQPLEYFFPETAPARLCNFREKVSWLEEHGIDRVICLRFNEKLAGLAAEQFVSEILMDPIGARYVVIGDDFRFGKARSGDFNLLQSLGDEHGFEVIATSTLETRGQRISSSLIRDLLANDKLQEAGYLLGRPYSMMGRVIHGEKRGRELGFPTANINIHRTQTPLMGIYAVRIHGLEGRVLEGVANIGTRPMFDGEHVLLEVFILDFEQNIYGQYLRVEFEKKIREEKKFDSVKDLIEQMHRDCEVAREHFDQHEVVTVKS